MRTLIIAVCIVASVYIVAEKARAIIDARDKAQALAEKERLEHPPKPAPEPPKKAYRCAKCAGKGSIVLKQPCGACGSVGYSHRAPCKTCKGKGEIGCSTCGGRGLVWEEGPPRGSAIGSRNGQPVVRVSSRPNGAYVDCPACNGGKVPCAACGGTGGPITPGYSPSAQNIPCATCGGKGVIVNETTCQPCKGSGIVAQ